MISGRQKECKYHGQIDFLQGTICDMDALDKIVSGKRCITFIKGHHGHIWTILVDVDSMYLMFMGNTRTCEFKEDTLDNNSPLLEWAIDSLFSQSLTMKAVNSKVYQPFYENLQVYSCDDRPIFATNNATTFSGPDSVAFNRKLNALIYFMYWHASSDAVRHDLPEPNTDLP